VLTLWDVGMYFIRNLVVGKNGRRRVTCGDFFCLSHSQMA
jgi:hypothetical protein